MWYYILNDKPTGPIEETQITKFVRDGVITQKTKVWKKGMPGWVSAINTELDIQFNSSLQPKPIDNSYCYKCGSPLSTGVAFCSKCGSKIGPVDTPLVNNSVNITNIVAASNKSVGLAILLTFLFGPLGLLYSTVAGGLIMMVLGLIIGIFTFGLGLVFIWPVCIVWAAVAANSHNKIAIHSSMN